VPQVAAWILYLAVSTVTMAANAQAFPSPEAAFEAYERARLRNDIGAFLATINFRQEAIEALQRAGKEATEANIAETAAQKESELRTHLQTRGFTKYGDCKVATKFRDSKSQVRFILSCTNATGATFFPIRVNRFPNGWLVVRG
jgi:hypothetical protein